MLIFVENLKHKAMAVSLIKGAGFHTKRVDTNNYKGVFGGTCNHVIGLFNKDGQVLCLDGKPYYPCGRRSAYNRLIETGDIHTEHFSFKELPKS